LRCNSAATCHQERSERAMARSLVAVSIGAEELANEFAKLTKDLYGLIFSLQTKIEGFEEKPNREFYATVRPRESCSPMGKIRA
jgi:hypothetical protein